MLTDFRTTPSDLGLSAAAENQSTDYGRLSGTVETENKVEAWSETEIAFLMFPVSEDQNEK